MSDDVNGRLRAEDGAPAPKPRLLLHAALFLATVLTTTAAGAIQLHAQRPGGGGIAPISDGLSYSIPLMLILMAHEAGHFIVARLYGVPASLPYFIPLPPGFGLGTMGAVIGMRNITRDRKRLIDIGAAGPLAGLLVAIPVIWWGLAHSQVGPLVAGSFQEGNSLLYALLKRLVTGAWLPDGQKDVFLHPTAFAGWAGLLVTMINLIPIGQLDGGHVATAYFGNSYGRVADRLHKLLPLLSVAVFAWVLHQVTNEAAGKWERALVYSIAVGAALPWMVWYLMVGFLRRISGGANHPPVDDEPLPRSRKALFWVMVAVFVSVFMPVVFRTTLAGIQPPPENATAPAPRATTALK
jgi:membrane-associated protease RseP (regulator of RpoE activity)